MRTREKCVRDVGKRKQHKQLINKQHISSRAALSVLSGRQTHVRPGWYCNAASSLSRTGAGSGCSSPRCPRSRPAACCCRRSRWDGAARRRWRWRSDWADCESRSEFLALVASAAGRRTAAGNRPISSGSRYRKALERPTRPATSSRRPSWPWLPCCSRSSSPMSSLLGQPDERKPARRSWSCGTSLLHSLR